MNDRESYEFWAKHVLPMEIKRMAENERLRARARHWAFLRQLGIITLYSLLTAAFLRAFL